MTDLFGCIGCLGKTELQARDQKATILDRLQQLITAWRY